MHNNILGHHHQDHEDQIWLFNSLITTSQPNIQCVCVCAGAELGLFVRGDQK
jgi:hypothetical protein